MGDIADQDSTEKIREQTGRPTLDETAHDEAREDAVLRALDTLRVESAAFHDRAAAYEENARALHRRVETLQHDQVRELLKPFFQRLASLHAYAMDSATALGPDDDAAAGDFRYFATTIEDMFSLYDIDSVAAEEGAAFDAKTQQAARVIATDDPSLDGTVHRVVRQGFIFAGADRVFLPARVSVYRHSPAESAESASSDNPAASDAADDD